MCRAQWEGGRRCDGSTKYFVNAEAHARFMPDTETERHFYKPSHLCSMKPDAIRTRRSRARKYAAEVDAVRTIHGVPSAAPIGPVFREDLWAQRFRGGVSLVMLARHFEALALEGGVSVEEVAERHQTQTVRPSRMAAGERLADLVVERPDWVNPDHLVRMVEPPENGSPNAAYCRVVTDADRREWVLVTSYDGSEPMVWPHTTAGLKAGAWECLERVRAVTAEPAAYDSWLSDNQAGDSQAWAPYEQAMSDGDFLANSGEGGMHLV